MNEKPSFARMAGNFATLGWPWIGLATWDQEDLPAREGSVPAAPRKLGTLQVAPPRAMVEPAAWGNGSHDAKGLKNAIDPHMVARAQEGAEGDAQ